MFLRETPSRHDFRLSLRGKGDIDVAALAERFGGGGHRSASGCTVEGTLQEVTERMLGELLEITAISKTSHGAVPRRDTERRDPERPDPEVC
jgi:nanoRNase/pAp phosphatase (c-di-AMP/oligoRNAs hydrolase)